MAAVAAAATAGGPPPGGARGGGGASGRGGSSSGKKRKKPGEVASRGDDQAAAERAGGSRSAGGSPSTDRGSGGRGSDGEPAAARQRRERRLGGTPPPSGEGEGPQGPLAKLRALKAALGSGKELKAALREAVEAEPSGLGRTLTKLQGDIDSLLQAVRGIWEIAKFDQGLHRLMEVDGPSALWPILEMRADPELRRLLASLRARWERAQEGQGQGQRGSPPGKGPSAGMGVGEAGSPSPAKKAKTEPGTVAAVVAAAPSPWLRMSPDTLENLLNDLVASCSYTLSVVALKAEYQSRVALPGSVQTLVTLLKTMVPVVRCGDLAPSLLHIPGPEANHPYKGRYESTVLALQKVVETVTNMSHERTECKDRVRLDGGIAPLAELLKSPDRKLQRSTAAALRTLAFKNDKNKDLIVECGAVSTLVCLLHARDAAVHNEAVGAIGNLVHSCPKIKNTVLKEGALQPIIKLLQSSCPESRKEAALLLGQFATVQDPDLKSKIVQRGALPPLVQMLSAADPQLQEMAAFAVGRLAQNSDNQVGLMHHGAMPPLLKLLSHRVTTLQHNAAFAIYGISDNPENVCELLVQGVVHCLQRTEDFESQASKDCAKKTLTRLQDKVAQEGSVTKRLCHILITGTATERLNVAVSLAHLCPKAQLGKIFASHGGFHILMQEILALRNEGDSYLMCLLSRALDALAEKSGAKYSAFRDPPASAFNGRVCLGEPWLTQALTGTSPKSPTADDPAAVNVEFLVGGGTQYRAHREAFHEYGEKLKDLVGRASAEDGADLPLIRMDEISPQCFKQLMIYLYTGIFSGNSPEVKEVLEDLATLAHQYEIKCLQLFCEAALKKNLSQRNIMAYYDLGGKCGMRGLQEASMLYAMEHMATEVTKRRDGCKEFIVMIKIFSAQLREYFLPFIAKCT